MERRNFSMFHDPMICRIMRSAQPTTRFRFPVVDIPATAERVQRIHGRRQAVGFALKLPMHYNQFYHLHAIRVNPYDRVDFGRLAAKNMPTHSAHTLSDVSAQLTRRNRIAKR